MLSEPATASPPTGATPLRVFGLGINGAADQLALRMLGELVKELPIALEISSARLMASELVSQVKTEGYGVVCLADLPPSPPSRTRLLVKRLRRAMPDVRIAVGRWTPPDLVAETSQPLIDAGASHVAFALLETRKYLSEVANAAAPAAPIVGTLSAVYASYLGGESLRSPIT